MNPFYKKTPKGFRIFDRLTPGDYLRIGSIILSAGLQFFLHEKPAPLTVINIQQTIIYGASSEPACRQMPEAVLGEKAIQKRPCS